MAREMIERGVSQRRASPAEGLGRSSCFHQPRQDDRQETAGIREQGDADA